jgi:hypothetical protein
MHWDLESHSFALCSHNVFTMALMCGACFVLAAARAWLVVSVSFFSNYSMIAVNSLGHNNNNRSFIIIIGGPIAGGLWLLPLLCPRIINYYHYYYCCSSYARREELNYSTESVWRFILLGTITSYGDPLGIHVSIISFCSLDGSLYDVCTSRPALAAERDISVVNGWAKYYYLVV